VKVKKRPEPPKWGNGMLKVVFPPETTQTLTYEDRVWISAQLRIIDTLPEWRAF